MRGRWFLLLAASCLAHLGAIAAQQELPGLEVQHWFPDQIRSRRQAPGFTAGDMVDVVVGVRNTAGEAVNLTAVGGAITSPHAYFRNIQNLTSLVGRADHPAVARGSIFSMVSMYLNKGEEGSVMYSFQPYPGLPATQWQLALNLWGQAAGGSYFGHTFFNSTIEILDKPVLVDFQLLFLYLLVVAGLGVAGFFAYGYITSLPSVKKHMGKKKPRKAPVRQQRVETPEDKSEWLKGTGHDRHLRQQQKALQRASSRGALKTQPNELPPAMSQS